MKSFYCRFCTTRKPVGIISVRGNDTFNIPLHRQIVGLTHFYLQKDMAFYKCFAKTWRTIMFVDLYKRLHLALGNGSSCQTAFWSSLGWFSMWQIDIDMAMSGLLLQNLSCSLQVRYVCSTETEVFPLRRCKFVCPNHSRYICQCIAHAILHITCQWF